MNNAKLSEDLLEDLFIILRANLLKWSKITNQTPQARMGYVGQHLTSIVTGYKGGKSGARGRDLLIGKSEFGEIKTCYRIDQLGTCLDCKKQVASFELECLFCGGNSIERKDDFIKSQMAPGELTFTELEALTSFLTSIFFPFNSSTITS